MTVGMWILIGGLVGAFILWRLLLPSLDKVVDQASEKQDMEAILQAISRRAEGVQPTAFNHAIRRLWDRYHRPLAVKLIKELAARHESSSIAQYWINQVLTVEPGLAKENFSKDFLNSHYKPEVAAKCGQVG